MNLRKLCLPVHAMRPRIEATAYVEDASATIQITAPAGRPALAGGFNPRFKRKKAPSPGGATGKNRDICTDRPLPCGLTHMVSFNGNMAGRVFISCGQSDVTEKKAANAVAEWLKSEGFDPYIATEVQTLPSLNADIIGEIKRSDYFLFINFRREFISDSPTGSFRGSLFSNQELAIAYAFEYQHMILLNQRQARREGFFSFIVSNSPEFNDDLELLSIVQYAVKTTGWTPQFSRNLYAVILRCGDDVYYDDYSTQDLPGGKRLQRHCLGYIENKRSDTGANNTVVRLVSYVDKHNGVRQASPDRANLKASGRIGYEHTIWPKSEAAFDLFALHLENPGKLFLNSEHDFRNRAPILSQPGDYDLHYEAYSYGFPILPFVLSVRLENDPSLTEIVLDGRERLMLVPGNVSLK